MHQRIPKTFSVILVLFIIGQTFSFLFLNLAYTPSSAAEAKFTIPDLQIKLFDNFEFSKAVPCKDDPTKTCVNWIGDYIAGIYKYAIGVVGILATVVMMFGGVMWIVAGGNATRIGEAKAWIGAALTGLVLALTSYVILYQINPSLTQFRPIKVKVTTDECAGTCHQNQECVNINDILKNRSVKITKFGPNYYACLSTLPGNCTYVIVQTRQDNGDIYKVSHSKKTANEKGCIYDLLNVYNTLSQDKRITKNHSLSILDNTYDYAILTGLSGCCLYTDGTCENITQNKCTGSFSANSHCGPISSCESD